MVALSVRHVRIPPTREVFYSPTTGSKTVSQSVVGAHVGYLMNQFCVGSCYTEVLIPWDFKELVELVMVVIPVTSAFQSTMTVSLFVQYAKKNQAHNENSVIDGANVPMQYSWNAITGYIQEVNITGMVQNTNQFVDRGLEAGDYLGVSAERNATNGDNCNARILGVRMRYKVFKSK